MAQILIIDDEVLLARSLSRTLTQRGHDCSVAGSAEEGLPLIRTSRPDIVLLDMQLPGISGLTALEKILEFDPSIVVLIVTAYGTVASAVEAMRKGASDFLRKPLDIEEVSLTIERALANVRMRDALTYYQNREVEQSGVDQLIGASASMQAVLDMIDRLAGIRVACASDCSPTLITGETGTGKDLAARIIHHRSKFSDQPFIDVNCPSLPRGLEEAELFGYERGAFTDAHKSKRGLFEAASGGTLFLNEIGDLPPEVQVKLLQTIERKTLRHIGGLRDIPIDVRIIAATNRDLRAMIKAGSFREDLYHRLHHFYLEMPPLRDRGGDIAVLAAHFLNRAVRKYGLQAREFSKEAVIAMQHYTWPGNLRELDHVVDRAVFVSRDTTIGLDDLGLPGTASTPEVRRRPASPRFVVSGETLDEIEREAIRMALTTANGNVSEAARSLGIGREALRYRIQKHRLAP
ncbi:MAG: sigma-54 dependent transcriptional regulator [Candidatus Zixiibacteriota bacterium]